MASRHFGRKFRPTYLSATARQQFERDLVVAFAADCKARGTSVNRALFDLVRSYLYGVSELPPEQQ